MVTTYVGVDAAVGPGADEGDELVASLVDHKAANLALVALLAEAPEKRTKRENTLVMSTPINNGAAFQLKRQKYWIGSLPSTGDSHFWR